MVDSTETGSIRAFGTTGSGGDAFAGGSSEAMGPEGTGGMGVGDEHEASERPSTIRRTIHDGRTEGFFAWEGPSMVRHAHRADPLRAPRRLPR